MARSELPRFICWVGMGLSAAMPELKKNPARRVREPRPSPASHPTVCAGV